MWIFNEMVDVNLSEKIDSYPDAILTSKISHENCNNLSKYDHINHGNRNWSSLALFWCITEVRRMIRRKEMLLLYMSVKEKHPVCISQTCTINQDLNHWHLFKISSSKVSVKQQISHIIESDFFILLKFEIVSMS